MKYASVTGRLADLGGEKWEMHLLGRKYKSQGKEVLELTIGEPDVPTPMPLIDVATTAMRAGRTNYSDGRGEADLLSALSKRYTHSVGRAIGHDQFLCFPGTQTALYSVLMGISEAGDEILVGDPMYACYEGVIAASGAKVVPVPLNAENGFRITAADIADRITTKSRAIFLNTPHNPTGAVLTAEDLAAVGALARENNLWIISDEVYEEMLFKDTTFTSPLAFEDLADRVIVVSSISKSHAAPGFRSGWCVGPAEFTSRLLPLSETMLFGNQPFIADMTAEAISAPSEVAAGMCSRFSNRADYLYKTLNGVAGLQVSRPQAGMFILVDISATGMSSRDYAIDLLEKTGVAVMPGSSFGESLDDWVRITLTADDDLLKKASQRIAEHAQIRTGFHPASLSPASPNN